MKRSLHLALSALLALALGACGGDDSSSTGGAGGEAGAGAAGGSGRGGAGGGGGASAGGGGGTQVDAAALAGIWTGATDTRTDVAFTVDRVGSIHDLGMHVELRSSPNRCFVWFTGSRTRLDSGSGKIKLTSPRTNLELTATVKLTPSGAEGRIEPSQGSYSVDCNAGYRGEGNAVVPTSWTATRASAPPQLSGAKRLLQGWTRTIGTPINGCAENSDAGGAGWCGVVTRDETGRPQLWAIDPSNEAPAKCSVDAKDARCIHLSDSLAEDYLVSESSPFPRANAFKGDTLFFYRPRVASTDLGAPLHAWRPGWPQARRVLPWGSCSGGARHDSLICWQMERSAADPPGVLRAELRGGSLGDGTRELPVLGNVVFVSPSEAAARTSGHISFDVSADGARLAWLGRPADGAEYELSLVDTNAGASSRRTLATGIARWVFSNDGKRMFWIRGADPRLPLGTLEFVDLPGGTAKRIADSINWFREISLGAGHGLLARRQDGNLILIRDVSTGTAEDLGVTAAVPPSEDDLGQFIAWPADAQPDTGGNVAIGRTSLAADHKGCTFAVPGLSARAPLFSSQGDKVLYTSGDGGFLHYVVGQTSDCSAERVVRGASWSVTSLFNDFVLHAESTRVGLGYLGTIGAAYSDGSAQKWKPLVSGVTSHFALREWSDTAKRYRQILSTVDGGWDVDGLYVTTEQKPR